jgi:hypothetical protein
VDSQAMGIDHLAAIDTDSHLEVSCRDPLDSHGEAYDRAADKCVKSGGRPTLEETIACYRGRKVGFVNFTVDAEAQLGRMRISNEEIAEAGQANSDIMSAFGVKFQLFGSDFPLTTPDRWMADFAEAGFRPDVPPPILKDTAVRQLRLGAPSR